MSASCRLCLQAKPLCKSHILPEFLYEELYDGKHRFIACTDLESGTLRFPQKGYREPLLCAGCESFLNSRYEKHSRRLFHDPLPPASLAGGRMRAFPRLDYSRLKLFFLSIVWRAAVCENKFFNTLANLDADEDDIRRRLLSGDAGGALEFPTVLSILHFDGIHFRDFMTSVSRSDNPTCFRLVLSGFVVLIFKGDCAGWRDLLLAPGKPVTGFDSEFETWAFLRESRRQFQSNSLARDTKKKVESPEATWTASL